MIIDTSGSIFVDGVRFKYKLTGKTLYGYESINLYNRKDQPFAQHKIPVDLAVGQKVRTGGHQYKIEKKAIDIKFI